MHLENLGGGTRSPSLIQTHDLALPIVREGLVQDLVILGDACEHELSSGVIGPLSRHLKFEPEAAPRIVAVLSALVKTIIDDYNTERCAEFLQYCCGVLVSLFHQLKPYERAYCHGIHSAILRVLGGMAHVTMGVSSVGLEIDGTHLSIIRTRNATDVALFNPSGSQRSIRR